MKLNMNQNKSIINKICQAPIKVFQSKLKYAITNLKLLTLFLQSVPDGIV